MAVALFATQHAFHYRWSARFQRERGDFWYRLYRQTDETNARIVARLCDGRDDIAALADKEDE
jgi:hypothetical protein